MRRDVKVGLITLVSLIVLLFAMMYFWYIWNTYPIYAEFDSAAGLSRLDDVSLADMRIGSVWDLSLTADRKVRAVMLIHNRYRDYIPDDSTARIISGPPVMSDEFSVDIRPGISPSMLSSKAYIRTESTVEIRDLLARAEMLANTMQSSFDAVDDLLGDPEVVSALRRSAFNMETASERTAALVGGLQSIVSDSRSHIPEILSSVDNTAGNFEALSHNLRGLADQSVPELKQTSADIASAAQDLRAVSRGLRVVVESTDPSDIQSTLESIQAASEDIEAISSRLRALAEDPDLAAQGRMILNSLQKALDGAVEVMDQVQKLIETRESATPQDKDQ